MIIDIVIITIRAYLAKKLYPLHTYSKDKTPVHDDTAVDIAV